MHKHGLMMTLLLIPICLLGACADKPVPAATPGHEPGQQCTWTCKRWEKSCSVDPRGEYNCRRQCADFGEVCE